MDDLNLPLKAILRQNQKYFWPFDTSPTSALPASTGYGTSDASGAPWTWTRPQHLSTPSYRRMSTIATFCWQVHWKWSQTGCNGSLLNAAAHVVSSTHKYNRGLSRLLNSELHWLDVPERVQYKLRRNVQLLARPITAVPRRSLCTSVRRTDISNIYVSGPTSHHGIIFDPLLGVSWWFRDAGSAHSVHGLFLLPVALELYQTAWEIRILAGRLQMSAEDAFIYTVLKHLAYTWDDADVTLMILSMFTVAKAILEVLTVLQEFNVIRSVLLLCLELHQ